jgi:hypothetical protein
LKESNANFQRLIGFTTNAAKNGSVKSFCDSLSGLSPIPRPTLEKAKEMHSQKISFREIGRTLGIDEGTIRKRFKKK